MDWVPIVVALVAASPGIFVFLRDLRKSRSESNKNDADAAKTITEAAGAVVLLREEHVKNMELRISLLENHMIELDALLIVGKEHTMQLYRMVKEFGGTVPETPELLRQDNWPKLAK